MTINTQKSEKQRKDKRKINMTQNNKNDRKTDP